MADVNRHRKLHEDEHHAGGIDEIGEGELLPQVPTDHASTHEEGGSDELSLDATQIAGGEVTNQQFNWLTSLETYAADQDYVDSAVQGVDWQKSVLEHRSDPPSSPSTGDRYLVNENATGDWDGYEDQIAEWDGSSWKFFEPNDGWTVWIEDENKSRVYNDSYPEGTWVAMSSTVTHSSLKGLGADDHTQYLLVDGSRAMDGSLDMGTNDITSVGTVDGINISAHDHDGDAPNIPNAGLVNDSVTVTAGTHLSGGGSVSLGSSTSLSFDGSNVGWGDLDIDQDDIEMSNISPANTSLDMNGNDIVDGGTTIYDSANNYIPLTTLEEDTITINTGDGLSGGTSLTLGDSTTLNIVESEINHDNLSGGTTDDAHHTPFIGLKDDTGSEIDPNGSYRIQIDTDDTIDAEAGENKITLSTTDQAGVTDHSELTGLDADDHTHYLLADGTRSMSGSLDMDNNDIDNVGEISPDTFKPRLESQSTIPSLSSNEMSFWYDTENNQMWGIIEYNGNNYFVEFSG